MPQLDKTKKEIKKRGNAIRYRTIKPKGKKSKTYFHIAVVPKKGPRGGHTVIGPKHHKESFNLDKYLDKLFESN